MLSHSTGLVCRRSLWAAFLCAKRVLDILYCILVHHFKCGFTLQDKMIDKRPFVGEDSYEVACKHPRLLELANEQSSPTVDAFTFNDGPQKFHISGSGSFSKCPDEETFASELVTEVSNETYKGLETGSSGSFARFWWASSTIVEANVRPEAAAHLSLFPEFFEPVNRLRALLHSEEICSSPVDYPSQKLVSVGPQHQAQVPEWDPEGARSSDHLEKLGLQHELQGLVGSNEEKLIGTCIMSTPNLEASDNYFFENVGVRNNCKCADAGSVRCVRQHVMEARDKLRQDLGQNLFEELGFYEMGEEVAERWTKEEERAFHDVILSNHASLGEKFWHHLSVAFPSRTHKDLVSYYFNVFLLRKRAEQNRFDPLNIDSDDDEWQKGEFSMVGDEEDLVVKSPKNLDVPAYNLEESLEGFHEHIEDEDGIDGCQNGADCIGIKDTDVGYIDDGSGVHVGNSSGDCAGATDIQVLDKIPCSNRENHDVQDDSFLRIL